MKTPNNYSLVFSTLCLSLTIASVTAADSLSLDRLQGVWAANRTNHEGQVSSKIMEFKAEHMTFKLLGADGDVRFFAKGTLALEKLGPFQTLKITNIKAGRSDSSTDPVDDERTSVFVLDGDTLTLASNFDKTREGQPPGVETYARSKAAAAQTEDAAAKLAGTWKMDVHLGENDADYELRLSRTDGALSAILVSPRSGEHKFRTVTWADDKLVMELDREYDGNTFTLIYTGKATADGLSGTVAAKGAEDQYSGTWKARK